MHNSGWILHRTAISGLLICASKLRARFLVWHKIPSALCIFLHHYKKTQNGLWPLLICVRQTSEGVFLYSLHSSCSVHFYCFQTFGITTAKWGKRHSDAGTKFPPLCAFFLSNVFLGSLKPFEPLESLESLSALSALSSARGNFQFSIFNFQI